MVDVFIVHSGKDYDYIKKHVEPYLMGRIDENDNSMDGECNVNILTLTSGKKGSWKRAAARQIKMAQAVIVVIGADASEGAKMETMGWEVKKAIRYNKQIMIVNLKDYEIPSYLVQPDRFTHQHQLVAKIQTLEEVKRHIDDFARGYYNIFSPQYNALGTEEKDARKSELLDQYKMFQKTSEDLVARRQSVNSFYISVNSVMVTLLGVVIGLVENQAKLYFMIFLCLTGIILDISWISILDAYGTLNAAKMKVINLLEKQLPVALYEVEWRVMSDKLNNKKYVSFTNSEKRIPKLFASIYIIILLTMLIYALSNLTAQ